jgi:hypothetical protein
MRAYAFIIDNWVLDIDPTWSHDFPLENEQLKCAGVGTHDSCNVRTTGIVENRFLYHKR